MAAPASTNAEAAGPVLRLPIVDRLDDIALRLAAYRQSDAPAFVRIHIADSACRPDTALRLAQLSRLLVTVAQHRSVYLPPDPQSATDSLRQLGLTHALLSYERNEGRTGAVAAQLKREPGIITPSRITAGGLAYPPPLPQVARLDEAAQERLLAARVDPVFRQRLVDRIRAEGPITFAEYMRTCLYSPGGYYSSGTVQIGDARQPTVDFTTLPELSPYFGRLTTAAFNMMFEEMGGAGRFQGAKNGVYFDMMEGGPGNGAWARDILHTARERYPDLAAALRYTMVDISAGLSVRQQATLAGETIRWVPGSAIDTPLPRLTGVFHSNEMPDAFPVHRIVRRGAELREIYVTVDGRGDFQEIEGKLSPAVQAVLHYYPPLEDGQTCTVSPSHIRWLNNVCDSLTEGFIFTNDYGRSGACEQEPWTHFQATQPLDWAYRYPGAIDMTSAVDFGVQIRAGEERGLAVGGLPQFGKGIGSMSFFLSRLGFHTELEQETDLVQAQRAWLMKGNSPQTILIQRKPAGELVAVT